MNSFKKRTISGAIGIILLFLVILKGGFYLNISILLLSLLGLREIYNAFKNIEINPVFYIGYLTTFLIFLSFYYTSLSMSLIISFTIIISLIHFIMSKRRTVVDISLTIFGIIYIPFLLSHLKLLDGTKYIWLVFIIAFGTDTFAYIFGNLFGKHKLAPVLSPNKTIEGSIGGIVGSLILTLVFSLYMNIEIRFSLIVMSIIVSICSQLGDLAASKIKRWTKIKDYGFIMPGHGGVLDRFDSVIFTTPLVYYYIKYFLI